MDEHSELTNSDIRDVFSSVGRGSSPRRKLDFDEGMEQLQRMEEGRNRKVNYTRLNNISPIKLFSGLDLDDEVLRVELDKINCEGDSVFELSKSRSNSQHPLHTPSSSAKQDTPISIEKRLSSARQSYEKEADEKYKIPSPPNNPTVQEVQSEFERIKEGLKTNLIMPEFTTIDRTTTSVNHLNTIQENSSLSPQSAYPTPSPPKKTPPSLPKRSTSRSVSRSSNRDDLKSHEQTQSFQPRGIHQTREELRATGQQLD